MKFCKLKHSIILQSPGGNRDSVGERVTTWTNVATVFASINPLTIRESFEAEQVQSSVTHKVVIRYDTAIAAVDHSWRILFGTRIFIIDGVRNILEENEMFELKCTEGLREE